MSAVRRQLTLFIKNEAVEAIRAKFNPVQRRLIDAHITLCREDEIEDLGQVIENVKAILSATPLRLKFDLPERCNNGKGVLIPATASNPEFDELRKIILSGIITSPRKHQPHITLMHPRNSTCTDDIFKEIIANEFPRELTFDTISLIEQENDGIWEIVQQFKFHA